MLYHMYKYDLDFKLGNQMNIIHLKIYNHHQLLNIFVVMHLLLVHQNIKIHHYNLLLQYKFQMNYLQLYKFQDRIIYFTFYKLHYLNNYFYIHYKMNYMLVIYLLFLHIIYIHLILYQNNILLLQLVINKFLLNKYLNTN